VSLGTTILRFLDDHRGAAFCTRSIAVKVAEGRDIDVTMRHVEGSGVIRRHGQCAACRLPCLVASVPSSDN
jgi:hypothetical protein